MLFPEGKRPDVARLREAVASQERISISHDPSDADAGAQASADQLGWIELLRDGMTFDLVGLAPGDPPPLPTLEHRFDCPDGLLQSRKSALRLAPGPHLAAGANSLPVVRTMAGLAAALVRALPDLPAVGWAPSASLIGRDFFVSTVEAWLSGGPFPALGFTAFRASIDEGLQSVGLAYFTGQELRIEPVLAADRTAATRLAVRLVNLLVGIGPLTASERVTGLDGATLRLDPSPNGRYVRVYPG